MDETGQSILRVHWSMFVYIMGVVIRGLGVEMDFGSRVVHSAAGKPRNSFWA